MLDPMTTLAFSVYSSRGTYALLLGSGISRSSGVPTGWDIVQDLIRKIAAVEGKDCDDDPAAWYLEVYGKEPGYTELLEESAKTSTARMQLLRDYFEPTEGERERGQKLPTPAHHAIAKLVADGYFRVVVTTNFDRLLELALVEAGVVPSVISTTDGILGAVPLSQARCTIIKVHGDYLDTRLRNTPDEVGRYDEAMNRLLDQVFDEYGLIVCGWSADWDVALRSAIERCPNRRFTTFWSAFRDVTGTARQLCERRGAQLIKGMGADEFFRALSDKVTALAEITAQHPLTARMAVATLKRYMAEEKHTIRLHDMVMQEANNTAIALFSNVTDENRSTELKHYESKVETLIQLLITGGYWGKPEHRKLWLRCFYNLVTPRSGPSPGLVVSLDFYPAYLALYAYGMAAIAGGRQGNLAYVLARAKTRMHTNDEIALPHRLVMELRGGYLDKAASSSDSSLARSSVPCSRYFMTRLREPFREWLPEDDRYTYVFYTFEYIFALVVADIYERYGRESFGALGGWYMSQIDLPDRIQDEIDKLKDKWTYLRAGLFGGSLERLQQAKTAFDRSIAIQRSEKGFR